MFLYINYLYLVSSFIAIITRHVFLYCKTKLTVEVLQKSPVSFFCN